MARRRVEEPTEAELALARLTARTDQALAIADAAMRSHAAHRQMVDVLLDITNALRAGAGRR